MGVFDRLGNLGRGMVRLWASPEGRPSREDLLAELDRLEDEARRMAGRPRAERTAAADDPRTRKLALLHRAFEDGILTRDEYVRKVAETEAARHTDADPVLSADRPSGPRKRRL